MTDPQDISEDELIRAARKITIRKAPGPDGVPGLVIKAGALNAPDLLRWTFNACLQDGCFLAQWKVQSLVLLPKGNKPPDEPSSYRPLCLLDIAGKLFERVINARLEAAIDEVGGLVYNQFDLRLKLLAS